MDEKPCKHCGTSFLPNRSNQLHCSAKCRQNHKEQNKKSKDALLSHADRIQGLCNTLQVSNRIGFETLIVDEHRVLIDAKVFDAIKELPINISKNYARTYHKGYPLTLHSLVIYLTKGILPDKKSPVDHINRNKFDNRIENLRIATVSGNRSNVDLKPNQVGYKGVYLNYDKWIAQITINGKVKHIGRFDDPKDAAIAYNNAAIKQYGEFAVLNDI